MLPVKPKFDMPPSVLDGVVPEAPALAHPVSLQAHFPKVPQGASALAHLAVQGLGADKPVAKNVMPTLAQRYAAKLTAGNAGNRDVTGRFVDGSGAVPVGAVNHDEFPLLRALGQDAMAGASSALFFGAGVLDLFGPGANGYTPEARQVVQTVSGAVASKVQGLQQLAARAQEEGVLDALTHTVSEDAAALVGQLDWADQLAKEGQYDESHWARADAYISFLGGAYALGATRFAKVPGLSLSGMVLPRPKIDLSKKIKLKHISDKGNSRRYEYRVSGDHFLVVTVKNGVLSDYIWVNPALRSTHGGGRDMLLSMLLRLQRDGVEVKKVKQEWLRGVGDNHRDYVLSKQVKKLETKEAAKATWSGNFWSSLGWKKVRVSKESDSGVVLYFE